MSFILYRESGARTVRREVGGGTLRIGRGAGVDLRLEDTAVALEHAVLRADAAGRCQLFDLETVTGTFVNGEPATSAWLHDGDEIRIGGTLLEVALPRPGGAPAGAEVAAPAIELTLREADAPLARTAAGVGPPATVLAARRIDYAAAYRLRRGILNKGFLGLVVIVLVVVAIAAVPAIGRLDVLRPGPVAPPHAERIAAANCLACHRPWRGASDRACLACHEAGMPAAAPAHLGPGAAAGPGLATLAALAALAGTRPAGEPRLAPTESARPGEAACNSCHVEHRGPGALVPAGSAVCVECHRDLSALGTRRAGTSPAPTPAAAGAEPAGARVARTITSFADHPELALTLPAAGAGGASGADPREGESGPRRLRLSDPAAARADPGTLAFGHALHMAPDLLSPEGRVQLACADCHRVTERPGDRPGGDLMAIEFEAHCERCHGLSFDAVFSAEVRAPHSDPRTVRGALYRAYQDERRRPGMALTRREQQAVLEAERRLYEVNCTDCHRIAFPPGGPAPDRYPEVEEAVIPAHWLAGLADFSHADHALPGLECASCHAGAAASKDTADVLLPRLAACAPCHVEGAREEEITAAGYPVAVGPRGCQDCHDYHAGLEVPALVGGAVGQGPPYELSAPAAVNGAVGQGPPYGGVGGQGPQHGGAVGQGPPYGAASGSVGAGGGS